VALGERISTLAAGKSKLPYMSSSGWSEISETLSTEGDRDRDNMIVTELKNFFLLKVLGALSGAR
jgi:hypothetical protein